MNSSKMIGYEEPALPRLVPEPQWCMGIPSPVICLDGEWDVCDYKDGSRRKVEVPFDMVVLRKKGFSRHYQYELEISVPQASEDARYVLRFEGVNGFAWVYLDEQLAGYHENGFVTWNIDVTDYLAGRKKVMLKVVMDEESDQVSAYSHGGILRSVYLYVLPGAYLDAVYLTPLFGEDMDTCELRVDVGVAAFGAMKDLSRSVWLELCDPQGKPCARGFINGQEGNLAEGDNYLTGSLPVTSPQLWDAEHPQRYTLTMTLMAEGRKLETIQKKIGLRNLERKGNRLFVNKQEIKLRGACRHEIHPLKGRAMTKELTKLDVELFKEANCNYIRTSHYPPSEYFLELCDEYGIYVEDELALAFIARTLPFTQRDPAQTYRYLTHFSEVMARDYNHAGVIIWSLCNESFGGYNFDLLNRFAHRKDPTRMTKFSYPMTIREEHEMPDIWSIHYSEYNADLAKKRDNVSVGHAPGKDMPVLHDEFVHVACYNREEHRRDPNVRTFWGESIRRFWDNIWNTEGCLGGAIWAGIDETDIYAGGNTQLEWGIIDVWRRRKPEHYVTRKAYSPIKVISARADISGRVSLVIENRFCHTDLSEVTINWRMGSRIGTAKLPEAKPGMTIIADIFPDSADLTDERSKDTDKSSYFADNECDELELTFIDAWGSSVEEILVNRVLPVQAETAESKVSGEPLTLEQKETCYIVKNKTFQMEISRETGLITSLSAEGKCLLTGGPYLNAPYLKLGEWYLTDLHAKALEGKVFITVSGGYRNTLSLTWSITITREGGMDTSYTINKLEKSLPRQLKLRVGVDCGGLDELGVMFLADPALDTLSWNRKGSYSTYPKDHISRNHGTARRYSQSTIFGQEPKIPWSQDMKNDMLNGFYDVEYKGTNDFRSTKENIYTAVLGSNWDKAAIAAVSKGEHSVRLQVIDPEEWKITDRDARIRYTGTWYCVEDKKESDHGTEMWSHEKGAGAECTFTGTGIVWYGPQDTTYGMADVYIDGELIGSHISQRVGGVDFSCSSVGYDKKYHLPVFSVTGLENGEHTIRIEVTGDKAEDASDCYIVIDYLRVLGTEDVEPIGFIINNDFAYPHLVWGNYCKPPILIEDGYTNQVHMRIISSAEQ